MVVATFKKAKRYVAPSKNVVAGPKAAKFRADREAAPNNPTKAVSTNESNGWDTHNPKQGIANFVILILENHIHNLIIISSLCVRNFRD